MDDISARRTTRGEVSGHLARAVVQWYRDRFGRGPTQAKGYVHAEVAFVVLGNVQTEVERSLVQGGEIESVELLRRRVRQIFGAELRAVVEEIVGARVVAMLGDHNAVANTTVMTFLLESPEDVAADSQELP
jgi:uncharacterized protein YbcI